MGTPATTRPGADRPAFFVDRAVPPELRANVEALARARVVVSIGLISILGELFFGAYSLLSRDLLTLGLCGVGAVVLLFNHVLLWRTRRVGPSATVVVALWMGSVIASGLGVSGDLTLRSGWPLFTVILATYLLGARAGLASAVVFALSLGGMGWMQHLGLLPTGQAPVWNSELGVVLAASGLLLLCAFIGMLHQRSYDRAVTEAAAARERSERSEAALRTVLDSTPDAIYSVDRGLRLLAMNRAGQATMRKRQRKVAPLGVPFLEEAVAYLPVDFIQRLRDGFARALQGEHIEFEETQQLNDKRVTATITIDPVRLADQTVVGATLFSRDITERRQREAQAMITDRMTTVGTLAAGMAHELNNPLSYVLSNLEFSIAALDPSGGSDSSDVAEVRPSLVDAREGAQRMRAIIRDLKTFARVDDTREGPVNVQAAMEAAVKMCLNELRYRARLVRDFQEVPAITGNATRLEQVFLNLLINAFQATPEGDAEHHPITVRTRTHPSGRVAIEVTDTGVGIPMENLKQIFDPFFTTKPVGVGTGLGLSICHNLIKSMGGEIEVASEPGRGSTFRVLLPPELPQEAPIVPPGAGVTAAKPATLLFVDDEASLGTSLRRVLRKHGVEVTAETQGREALERLRRGERYDLLLCDLMMPDLTGMDLFEEVGKLAPDQLRRMAFLSGGAFTARAQTFVETVAQPTLGKPCDVQQILDLLQLVRATGTTISPGAHPAAGV
jgi:PAS domain S-box-containing protein